MIQTVCDRITDNFLKQNIIDKEDREIYTYGLYQAIIILQNIVTTIVIGLAFKALWESIVFMIAYIPLRVYAGGYHAKTQFRCYILSVLILMGSLLGIKMILWTNLMCLIVLFASGILIILLSPVEDNNDNKPLNQVEKIKYRNRARMILGILISLALLFIMLELEQLTIVITCAVFVLGAMLVLGKISGIRNDRKRCSSISVLNNEK